jgi:hypothetical protein
LTLVVRGSGSIDGIKVKGKKRGMTEKENSNEHTEVQTVRKEEGG